MKKFFIISGSAILLLILILLVNTFLANSRQISTQPFTIKKTDRIPQNLREGIRIPTVTGDSNALKKFHLLLDTLYPLVSKNLTITKINHSRIYKWEGKNKKLKPVLFLAHQDVIPVENPAAWTVPPFAGETREGFLYGRGTMDMKCTLFGLLESTETLLAQNFIPERTIYFAFGEDEETGGNSGLKHIASFFTKQNISFEFVMDEGGSIVAEAMPGIKNPVAFVGIAEKGFLNLELTSYSQGGHSSIPPDHNPIQKISNAISKLQDHPFPASIHGVTDQMFDYLAPEMSFPLNVIICNRFLFGKIIENKFAAMPQTNALVRTTVAPTLFHSGSIPNAIPEKASATMNFRMLPGMSSDDVVQHVKKVIDDSLIQVKMLPGLVEPSSISDTAGIGFKLIQHGISSCFPEVFVTPYLTLGGTDSKHVRSLTKNIYRFIPLNIIKKDLQRIHGVDERLGIENYNKLIDFYSYMLKKL